MVKRNSEAVGGFTMIEILVALIVLVVGLVGVLALFPVGIDATGRAAQDTMGAILAESVQEALIDAMHNISMSGTDEQRIEVVFAHAGVRGVEGLDFYRFDLPTRIGESSQHPNRGPFPVFRLQPGELVFTDEDLREDPFSRYSYDFRVTRRCTNLYEFLITVYRNYPLHERDPVRIERSRIREYACLISTSAVGMYGSEASGERGR